MKTFFIVLVFSFLFNFKLNAGELLIRGFYGKYFHLEKKTESNQYIPEQFRYEQEIPGIGHFYNDANGFNIGLTYRFNKIENTKAFFILNFNYETQSLSSKNKAVDEVFGNKLNISVLAFTAGLGIDVNKKNKSATFYFNGGPLINLIDGQTSINNIQSEFNYKTSILFRFMTGMDIPIINSDHGISLLVSYDLGDLERGKVNYYRDSKWVARAKPTGDTNINDDRISIMFGFYFKIL